MIPKATIRALYPDLPDDVTIIESVNNPPGFPSNNIREIDWAKKGTVYSLPQEREIEFDKRVVRDEKGDSVVISVCRVSADRECIIYCVEK